MRLPRVRWTVRNLMIFVLILGGGIGWVVHRARDQRDAVAAIQAAGGEVIYDWERNEGWYNSGGTPIWPRWLVDRLGVDYFGNVVGVEMFVGSDAELVAIGRLSRLETISLNGSRVTDAGLRHLAGLSHFRHLLARGCERHGRRAGAPRGNDNTNIVRFTFDES